MVEWSPSVSMGSLIKNKLGKCFSTVVNLESFCFFGSGMPSGLCPSTPDSGRGAPARWPFLPLQAVTSGPPVPSPHQNWVPAARAELGVTGGASGSDLFPKPNLLAEEPFHEDGCEHRSVDD